jgi:glycosyltransferase involved in cell wall biosynthesis
MTISCLVVTGHSDLPETHLFIGLHHSGIQIKVMCPGSAPHRQLLIDHGVPVVDLELNGRYDKIGITKIKQQLSNGSTDIIHAFNNKAVSNSLIASKRYRCKFIAYRGIEGNVSYYDPMSWLTYLHPRVDVIVCVADAIRKYFWSMRFLGFSAPVKKAITIYKGHDPAWYSEPAADLSQFGVPEGSFVVVCTVNDRPRKGLGYLIEATNLLPKNLPIHIVLIGHIKNEGLLRSISQSAYAENIHLVGFQKNAAAIIKSCDVCILPAIKREGLPKGIIEGMIQGVAPIVTDAGGSPELIEDGKSGLIIPPRSSASIAEAISTFYTNKDILESVKYKAKYKIRKDFDIKRTIGSHVDLYKTI